jgi:hypothetical protein
MEKKTYDYRAEKVRTVLVDAFKRRKREATIADLMADTALPRVQVEEQLPAVADEYGARLKVTESGEILYSFPGRMRSHYRGLGPSLKRFLSVAGIFTRKALSFLFKAWIVLMLVGYFVLFLALLVLFLVGGTALQAGNRNSRSRGGGFNLVGGLLNAFIRIWFYSELFKSPGERARRMEARGGQRRLLHKAVFSFVFGDGDPNADWPRIERKALLAYLRANGGVVSREEFIILSGRVPEDAERALNAYCLEFEGSPEVTEDGVIYYSFPSVLRGVDVADPLAAARPKAKALEPFSANPKKANAWFAVINGVNILFGGFFLGATAAWGSTVGRIIEILVNNRAAIATLGVLKAFYGFVVALAAGIAADPVALVAIALGAVPVAFGILFYLIPLLRNAGRKLRNEKVKRENLRRIVYGRAWEAPSSVRAPEPESLPEPARPADPAAGEKLLDEFAAYSGADIEAKGSGNAYSFPELERARKAMASLRASLGAKPFKLGATIFDTEAPGDE